MTTADLVTHLIVLARAAESRPGGTLWADSEAMRSARREMTAALDQWVVAKIEAVMHSAVQSHGRDGLAL